MKLAFIVYSFGGTDPLVDTPCRANLLVLSPEDVVRREISTHHFRVAAVSLVTRPICPLARLRTVFNDHATRADVQLRPGESFPATPALSHFRELLSCDAVQLLQAGAREALGHKFHDVAVITKHQLVAHLASPSSRHTHVGVRPA